MPLHDVSYQHWDGVHVGIWGRRLAIAKNGLSSCLQNKWLRHLVVVCWVAALAMTAMLFLIGQLLVADSIIVQWAANLNPMLQNMISLLTNWLEQHPEISVHTSHNLLFYYLCIWLTPLSIFAFGLCLPLLITRDLASNAVIIYASKAVSLPDYLLGKFSTAFGLMFLTWLGPVCAAWFFGNLLAPDWKFFWHSRAVLFHCLVYGLACMTILSLLALGISAISRKEKSTPAFWFMWWVIGAVIEPIARQTQPALRHLSFNYNLDQLATAIFRPGRDLQTAQENIPLFGDLIGRIRPDTMAALTTPTVTGASIALFLMLVVAVGIITKKVKPE